MPDGSTIRWEPDRRPPPPPHWPAPGLLTAVTRGASNRCPACGQSRLFDGWLRVRPVCPRCTAPLASIRADDAPPYVVILLTAHVVIGALVIVDRTLALSVTAETAIFVPFGGLVAAALLRPVKGAVLGLMLSLGLAGDDIPAA